jgi:hypothetical protein
MGWQGLGHRFRQWFVESYYFSLLLVRLIHKAGCFGTEKGKRPAQFAYALSLQ